MATYDNKVLTGDQLVYYSGLVKTALAGKADTSALSGKQDALVFNTTYNATSNKVATMSDISNAVAGLAGAMHFKGSVQTLPTATDSATFAAYEAGDVVLGPNDKEYVYKKGNDAASSSWIELGSESSFALNTISITGTDGLTGGGALSNNQQISHAVPTGASAATLGSTTDNSGRKYIQTLTTDKFGHVTGATYASETVTNTTYSFAAGDNDGEIKVTPSTNGTTGTAISVKPKNLHKIATSGSIYDIEEGSNATTTGSVKYLIFDCGSATVLID